MSFNAGWRHFWSALDFNFAGACGFVAALVTFMCLCDIVFALFKWAMGA